MIRTYTITLHTLWPSFPLCSKSSYYDSTDQPIGLPTQPHLYEPLTSIIPSATMHPPHQLSVYRGGVKRKIRVDCLSIYREHTLLYNMNLLALTLASTKNLSVQHNIAIPVILTTLSLFACFAGLGHEAYHFYQGEGLDAPNPRFSEQNKPRQEVRNAGRLVEKERAAAAEPPAFSSLVSSAWSRRFFRIVSQDGKNGNRHLTPLR